MLIDEIYRFLDENYPYITAEEYDNSGYIYKSSKNEITKILLCLDCTEDAVRKAAETGAELIISHHPLYIAGLPKSLNSDKDKTMVSLIKNDISAISLHTNFDAAKDGLNEILAETIGLEIIGKFSENHAGVCSGIIGKMNRKTVKEIAKHLKKVLGCNTVNYFESGKNPEKIALVCGAGFSFFEEAVKNGADLFITGECKYYHFNRAKELGVSLIDAGHFYTEKIFAKALMKKLSFIDNVKIEEFEDFLNYKQI